MRLPALKHLVQAVHALARSKRICVLGSSALLGSFPELGEAGGPLEISFDGDLLLEPCDEQLAALLHEAVGEGSLFAQRSGYHADILRAEITETLPPGWESRLVKLDDATNSAALAPEDLLVVKLRAGREKDLSLCREVIRRGLVRASLVKARLDATPLAENEIVAVYQRFNAVTS
ncbi:MAG TPA: hypothetical protein PKA41_12390 [Verrucomicrobiota bacterium]|nr:hypothetical protein [Verrucomicrobiota bacterium]